MTPVGPWHDPPGVIVHPASVRAEQTHTVYVESSLGSQTKAPVGLLCSKKKPEKTIGVVGTPIPRGRKFEAKVPTNIPKNEFSQQTRIWYFSLIVGTFASKIHLPSPWLIIAISVGRNGPSCLWTD